ncbi:nickel/cobalt transporter [Aurantimonas sp. Leaf443]|uniref:nickel/cobalt transporter n=1 Tax=Aurantimonas sp. Leaf443 TaxID=1736378 RepID=UPI001FCDCB8C|nr:nickel/cobalt transporter [Aurantimonas sp. Leaf443]
MRPLARPGAKAAAGAVLVLALLACGEALARSSIGIGSAEAPVQPSGGLLGPLFTEIALRQRAFFSELRGALVALKSSGAALPALVSLSFAYGVFHAAGPGHGKAVISAYVVASGAALRRGILLSFVSALLQAGSAFALVGLGWFVLRGTGVSMTTVGDALETASYALLAAFGGWLLARALARRLKGRGLAALSMPRAETPVGALAFAAPQAARGAPIMRPASGGFAASVCEANEEDCGCGRTHIVDPARLAGSRLSARAALGAVVSVGLRPCSGAIVVLTFALLNGLYLGGALSVLAMALGTAVTVSAIAAFAVMARDAALKAGRAGRVARGVGAVLEVGGALALLLLGLALLGGALAAGG